MSGIHGKCPSFRLDRSLLKRNTSNCWCTYKLKMELVSKQRKTRNFNERSTYKKEAEIARFQQQNVAVIGLIVVIITMQP